MPDAIEKDKVWTPTVRLKFPRPEGDLNVTWVSPRSLGHKSGCDRSVFARDLLKAGANIMCPSGTADKVVKALQVGAIPSWKLAHVCEAPNGDMFMVHREPPPGRARFMPDMTGGSFCFAGDFWIVVVL